MGFGARASCPQGRARCPRSKFAKAISCKFLENGYETVSVMARQAFQVFTPLNSRLIPTKSTKTIQGAKPAGLLPSKLRALHEKNTFSNANSTKPERRHRFI
jgi:hypothetical protein